jgi:hypothetical protein
LDIFLKFVTPDVINLMYNAAINMDPNAFYSSSRKTETQMTLPRVYRFLAHIIRIQALQEAPTPTNRKWNALRDRFAEDQKHFKLLCPDVPPMGLTLLMQLHKKLIMCKETEAELSNNFQSVVKSLGQWVAGDEKLFKFLGKSGWIRIKQDNVGIWNYELCGRLPNDLSYLIDVKSHTVSKALNESIPTASVMTRWGTIIKRLAKVTCRTVLVADSYYLDEVGRYSLLDLGLPFLCGIQACRFGDLVEKAADSVKKPGKTAILYNKKSEETFCHSWYADSRLGKKYVLTNALKHSTGSTPKAWIPGCDDFALMFSTCDHYNRELYGKTFPHRASSDCLALNDFLFSCVLLNTFHVYVYSHGIDPTTASYRDVMLSLSVKLYKHGCSLL